MSADRPTSGRALARLRVTGLVFLLVLAALVALTIALYQKAFQPFVDITLQADRAGNQLTAPADVKVRGLIVGEARSVRASPEGAEIDLAIDPEQAKLLPANVQARLLPKTLFGEKYVELVVPEQPASRSLQSGDVIPQDRSQTARETSAALDSLLPLLRTLKPEQVSVTLNALSSTLRGRGDRLGSNLVLVRDYMAQFNPELPTLEEDFRGLADFAENLDAASPDLLRVLDDLAFVNRSLVDQRTQLDTFLRSTADVSGTLDGFLRENEQRFITLAAQGRGPLEVFAKYAPEYPCLAAGLEASSGFIGDAFGRLQPGLHITLEFTESQDGYQPHRDEPQYKDDRGPVCYGLERVPEGGAPDRPAPDINFQDGYRDELGPDESHSPEEESSSPFGPAAFSTPADQRTLLNAIVAPVMGVSSDRVPDVAHLLFGPVARGTAVGMSSRSAS